MSTFQEQAPIWVLPTGRGKGSRHICPALEGRQGGPCSAEELPLLLGSRASSDHCKLLRQGSANYLLPQRKVEEEILCLRGMDGKGTVSWGGVICTALLVWGRVSLKFGP